MLYDDEPDLRLFMLVAHIWEKFRHWMERQLKAIDLTLPQFGALSALFRNDRISQRELSEIVNGDVSTMVVICDSLEKKGLIQRLPDPSDRRVNRLVLTDSGKETVARVSPRMREVYNNLLNNTSANELKPAVLLLEKINRNANNLPDVFVNEK